MFPKTEEECKLPSSFYEASTTLTEKSGKNTARMENYKPISLMVTHAKNFNEILANQIQQHIKMITHPNEVRFISRILTGGSIKWEKIFANHVSGKGLICKI